MATGVATSQGYSTGMVAGIEKYPANEFGQFYFNQLSLSSTNPTGVAGLMYAPAPKTAFGKSVSMKSVRSDIKYLLKK